ncbi:MAG TPA: GAF domain-containing protein [Gemmatimonadales bacterium]|jgi:GAF domain-containing protein/biotin carboxyl carrier protein|nr:GAF domain-containing protein [Gemmatimonadales bacterium]
MTDLLGVPLSSADDLRQEVARLRLLHSLTLEFNATLDLDELLPRIFDRVLAALGAEGGSLWVAEGDMLRCRLAVGGRAGQRLVGAEMPVGSGFVGDVAQNQRTTMVMEAVKDPRYSANTDQISTTGSGSSTIMATAMVAGGTTVGAIQVVNKRAGNGVFDQNDRELLEGLAAAAAGALRNAQAHQVERRAHDLALLLDISREITATLDLDRVLQSVVNLASRALDFDRAAVALHDKGKCEIRAVAGQETADPKDPRLQDLVARTEWAAGRGEALYLSNRDEPGSDAERMFITIFGPDLEAEKLQSGLYLPLGDEEGVLGVLAFESAKPDFANETQREVAAILANQTAVALRNAQLYHQVPMVDALGALAAKKQALFALPRRKVQIGAGIALAVLAGLTLIRWPLRIAGEEPHFRPVGYAPVRALVDGVVERVLVREGSRVERGMPLAVLRATTLGTDREATAAEAASADRLAALAASRSDAAEERLQRARADALRREVALLDQELALTTVRAPAAGMVLTPRVEELVGSSLAEGDQMLALGRTDTLELEMGVAQQDILRVRPGQEVRLRVDALPQQTFEGAVTSVAQLPVGTGDEVHYPVRALIPNPDGLLRPEMAAHARVLTDPASTATRMFRGPWRWFRLAWWRLWS